MNKWLEILLGLVILIGAILIWYYSLNWGNFWNFGSAAWEVLKGSAMWIVILIGLMFLIIGINDLKE
ncbi:hypothetical protein K9L16_01005 [Candidatus Pacearchaeota archaeon]|nr:hypothetical protein [Candidatus Pacearchaeota archaeon]